jgi:hypothetical protein
VSAHMDNTCPPTRKTVVRPHGEHLSAYKEFSLSLDKAPCRIPGAAGRNSKGGSWVRWLTRIRKVNGTIACQKSDGQVQVLGLRRLRDPCDMAKAGLLEPQSPGDAKKRPSAWHLMPAPRPASA